MATNEGRALDLTGWTRAFEREDTQGLGLAFDLYLALFFKEEGMLTSFCGALANDDLARGSSLLQTSGDIDSITGHKEVETVGVVGSHDLASIDADTQAKEGAENFVVGDGRAQIQGSG